MAVLAMASNKSNINPNIDEDVKPTIFHDFLGKGSGLDSSPAVATAATAAGAADARPQSESVGASSSGGRGPISTTSDLGSAMVERQVGNHIEGVPFYGLRSDFSGQDIANRFMGNKRGNSDSALIGSSGDGVLQMRPDSLESSHLAKMLRSAGGERPRRPLDEEALFGMHPMRPTSTSFMLQQATSGSLRADNNASKWERAIPISVGPVLQYPPRAGQVVPFGYQASSNRFKDANAGPSIISQAADEGSRTGIKGSGILSSVNASGGTTDRNVPSGGNQKSGLRMSEPESSNSQSRQGVTSASRQMTIFYGGQAHVFDDVHPNKVYVKDGGVIQLWGLHVVGPHCGCAHTMFSIEDKTFSLLSTLQEDTIALADMIMALAGSNGGSWSTNFTSKSAVRLPPNENILPSGENEAGIPTEPAFPREFCGSLSVAGKSSHGFGSVDRMSMPPGFHQGNIVVKESRGLNQAADPSTENKRDNLHQPMLNE